MLQNPGNVSFSLSDGCFEHAYSFSFDHVRSDFLSPFIIVAGSGC